MTKKIAKHLIRAYNILVFECDGLDAVYEEYIIELVGDIALHDLVHYGLLETCGVVNGRQLYAIVDVNK